MSDDQAIHTRPLQKDDGIHLWRIAGDSHPLDLNSPYHYLLMSHHFGATSIAAEYDADIIGFITAYIPPTQPDTLFVWQVAVSAEARGKGIAKRMMIDLVERFKGTGLTRVEATITPSNMGSRGLFAAVARELHAPWEYETDLFTAADFGSQDHEPERLFRIGPIPPI